jgi:hypothetical protein
LKRYFSKLLILKVEAILIPKVVVVVVGGFSAVVVVVVVGGSSAVVVVVVKGRRLYYSESVLWTTNCPLVLACCGLGMAVTFCGHFYFGFKVYFLCLIKYTHDYPHYACHGGRGNERLPYTAGW